MQQLEHAPCLYFSTTDDGTLISVNETLCSILGFSKDELLGKRADIFFPVATRIFQQTHLFPLLKMQDHADEIFVTLQTKSKEQIPVLLNAERKQPGDKPVIEYVGIIVNNRRKFEDELIAAKKTAESALRENIALNEVKEQLQQRIEQLEEQMHIVKKQKEELEQFNRAVTHDLQEPLRKLSVFSDMMLQPGDKKNQSQALEKFTRALQRMHLIVSGLQQYVWLTASLKKAGNVNLNAVMSSVQQQLKNTFPGVDFSIQQQGLPFIYADKEQMQLLFYHVLSNALRFRKPGAAVHIKISAGNLLQNKFKNVKDKYGYSDFIKIEIADEGIGFHPQYREQVFGLFTRLHKGSGIGIGLALCKKIVDNHNGTISIDSKENEGTNVTILLPQNGGHNIS